jgi:hypothetical protein
MAWAPFGVAALLAVVVLCALVLTFVLLPGILPGTPAAETVTAGLHPAATPDHASTVEAQRSALTAEAGAALTATAVAVRLPDLVIAAVQIELEEPGCLAPQARLGTRVLVANAGQADAGPFIIEINALRRPVAGGLDSGGIVTIWVPGYTTSETTVSVDVTYAVDESDETNNLYAARLPLPTPPPSCTPAAEAAGLPRAGEWSIALAARLAPVRITSSAHYSDGPSSLLAVELDGRGNAHVVLDLPDRLEEWYLISGVIYAGSAPMEGVAPLQPVEAPASVAGFAQAMELFAPVEQARRYAAPFPLHAVLWSGISPAALEHLGPESVYGIAADKYKMTIEPSALAESVPVDASRSEALRAAVEADAANRVAYVWVEPESGAIVKAVWHVDWAGDRRAEFTLEVAPAEFDRIELPSG